MLKAIRRTFSLRFRNHVFVCLLNSKMPLTLRKRVRPRVFCCFACWIDHLNPDRT